MKGLAETQCEELIAGICSGSVVFDDLLVVGRFIYEQPDDRLLKRMECASQLQAQRTLEALSRLPVRKEGNNAC